MKHTNKNQDNDYAIEGYLPQESTTTISFEPFSNDPKFHSISATKYLTSGRIFDGAWGDITIELLESEIKEAEDYLISRNWEIVNVFIEKLIVKWSEEANLYD